MVAHTFLNTPRPRSASACDPKTPKQPLPLPLIPAILTPPKPDIRRNNSSTSGAIRDAVNVKSFPSPRHHSHNSPKSEKPPRGGAVNAPPSPATPDISNAEYTSRVARLLKGHASKT